MIESLLPPKSDDEANPAAAGAPDQPSEALEPRGNAAPTHLEPRPAVFYSTVVALALLLLLGLEALRRALAREVSSEAASEQEQDAFSALAPFAELLARLEHIDPVHGGAAHTGLSLALRRYIGRSFAFPAVESTTTEIQRQLLQPTPRLGLRPPADLAQRALELLRAADLVKFAGLEADPSTVRGRVIEAREIGQSMEEFLERELRPVAESPAEEAA